MPILNQLRPHERVILWMNLSYLLLFLAVAAFQRNQEFVIYAGVVLIVMIWTLAKQVRSQFSPLILWGLTLWGFIHLAGGTIRVGDGVLYGLQLIPVVLRYDQFVHALGFGAATLVCDHVLMGYLGPHRRRTFGLSLLTVLMGLGVGGINEIIEFMLTLALPKTNVGGYDNTMWDMVFNLIGAIIAVGYVNLKAAGSTRPNVPAA